MHLCADSGIDVANDDWAADDERWDEEKLAEAKALAGKARTVGELAEHRRRRRQACAERVQRWRRGEEVSFGDPALMDETWKAAGKLLRQRLNALPDVRRPVLRRQGCRSRTVRAARRTGGDTNSDDGPEELPAAPCPLDDTEREFLDLLIELAIAAEVQS